MSETNKNRARGCLFCLTGQENQVASMIPIVWPGARAHSVSAAKRRSKNGVRSIHAEVIMQGYVFFETDESAMKLSACPEGSIRVLRTMDGDWKLTGNDDAFARWLLENEGVIGISQAHMEGERIVMHAGPLKDLDRHIQRIDKRNGNAQILIRIGENEIRIWLPFEIESY